MKNFGPTLLDETALEDQFSGAGHSRTADQLARTIKEFAKHDKNRAIGLYGDWGSGKSSVVDFSKQKLDDENKSGKIEKFRFFTFDLWSANTSQFKRTLLEELIEWGQSQRSELKDDLKAKQDIVRDREITTTSDLSLTFTKIGILFLLFVPLIPIVYAWLGPEAFKSAPVIYEIDWITKYVGGWLGKITGWKLAFLSFSILAASLCGAVISRCWKKKERFGEAISHVLTLVSHKEKTNTVTQNIREKDPNEHEFDIHFRSILQLIQNDDSKVILVFDNIDRLNETDLVEYWALVRSVFSSSDMRALDKGQSCIVIVPYVASAVMKNMKDAAEDLFAKTFDLTLRVAPPVLSNVADFLELKLDERFDQTIGQEEKSAAIEIFEYSLRSGGPRTVTPRAIKSYVNDIADLDATWNGEIPLAAIAIYVCKRDAIENDPQILRLDSEKLAKYFRFDPSNETMKHLSALAFNVAPDLAYQTLLAPEILAALTQTDKAKIQELENIEGFTQVLKQVLQYNASTIANDGLAAFAMLCECANRICIDGYQRSQFSKDVLAALPNLQDQKIWDPAELSNLDPILKMLGGQRASEVVPVLAELLEKPIGEKPHYNVGRSWSYAVARVQSKLVEHGFGKAEELIEFFDASRGVDFALGLASTVNITKVDLGKMPKSFAARDMKDVLLAKVETNIDQIPDVAKGLLKAKKLTSHLAENLLTVIGNGLTTEQVKDEAKYTLWTRSYADTYRIVSKAHSKASIAKLDQLIDHGGFVWHIHQFCQSNQNLELLALGLELALLRLENENYVQKPNTGVAVFSNFYQSSQWFAGVLNSSKEITADIYQLVAERCASPYMMMVLAIAKSELSHAEIAKKTLNEIARADIDRPLQFVATILGHEEWLRDNCPDLLLRMLEDTKENITDEDLEQISIPNLTVSFVKDALKVGSDDWLKYDNAVTSKFENLSEEEWTSLLQSGGNSAQLFQAKLKGLGATPKSGISNLRNPLVSSFLSVLEGNNEKTTNFGDQIFDLLSDAMRKNVIKEIAGKISQTEFSSETLLSVDKTFPKTLEKVLNEPNFANSSDVVLTKLVMAKSKDVLEFLIKHSAKLSKQISKFSDDEKSALSEAFVKWFGEHKKPAEIESVSTELGLQIKYPVAVDTKIEPEDS